MTTREELEAQMAEFLAKGKAVEVVEEGVKAKDRCTDDHYTDECMRSAENQEYVHNPYYHSRG